MSGQVIVMGANGGIGQTLALGLSRKGYDVYATMRKPEDADQALKTKGITLRKLDVTVTEDFENAFEDFSADRPLSGFAYCIGSIDLTPFKASNDDHHLKAYEINLLGAVRALRRLEKSIKAGKGSVVLFSSIAVSQGYANHTVIGSAKGALEGFARALAAEWAGHVRVNCIAPSLTDTAIARPLTTSPQMREAIEKMHPITRLGTAEDSAALAEFLLDDQSSWITGQIFHVDGGRSTLRPKG